MRTSLCLGWNCLTVNLTLFHFIRHNKSNEIPLPVHRQHNKGNETVEETSALIITSRPNTTYKVENEYSRSNARSKHNPEFSLLQHYTNMGAIVVSKKCFMSAKVKFFVFIKAMWSIWMMKVYWVVYWIANNWVLIHFSDVFLAQLRRYSNAPYYQ